MKARRNPPRSGAALLAALWLLLAASVLGATTLVAATSAIASASNRIVLQRSEWIEEGCLQTFMALLAELSEREGAHDEAWRAMDSVLSTRPYPDVGCAMSVRPVGLGVSLATGSALEFHWLMCLNGEIGAQADSMSAALVDWRDVDDEAVSYGAERDWYAKRRRAIPRNGLISSFRELQHVRGFESVDTTAGLLGLERGRVWLARAPDRVVAAATGVRESAVRDLRARLLRPLTVADVGLMRDTARSSTGGVCEPPNPDHLDGVTDSPDGWVLRASRPGPPANWVEYALDRVGRHMFVARRRSWP